MSVSAVEATSAGLLTPTTQATSTTNSVDKDTFLQLLVAQLRYQDPTNPADTSQMMAQTAQFSALEQMQAVAEQTSQLLAAQVAFGASSLVGRTVTYPDSSGAEVTGVVDAVRFEATGPVLVVDGADVTVGSVLSVASGTTY